jgi:hypothetical protein
MSLWLCENDPTVAGEIDGWLHTTELQRIAGTRLFPGEWQVCFERPQHLLCRANAASLVMCEADPDMVITQAGTEQRNGRIIYYEGLERIRTVLDEVRKPIIFQISSYSTQGGNTPTVVRESVTDMLAASDFHLQSQVTVDNTMTSLVYTRGLDLWAEHDALNTEFARWLLEVG